MCTAGGREDEDKAEDVDGERGGDMTERAEEDEGLGLRFRGRKEETETDLGER